MNLFKKSKKNEEYAKIPPAWSSDAYERAMRECCCSRNPKTLMSAESCCQYRPTDDYDFVAKLNLEHVDFINTLLQLQDDTYTIAELAKSVVGLDKKSRVIIDAGLVDAIDHINEAREKLLLLKKGGEQDMVKIEKAPLNMSLDQIIEELTELHRGNIVDDAYADEVRDNAESVMEKLTAINGLSRDLLYSFKQTAKNVRKKEELK